ncbi:hypothetical protein C8D93_1216 [Sinimarinibacterium flocculans]|uniref:TspB protein n=2 Tax=Sinimarinibacterium flocculans TaxID=985250 RepID=A0A318E8U4_9GAMM|nr:hypothetical protein C8D93_1216 [Sinimarinibacterium flocculans]
MCVSEVQSNCGYVNDEYQCLEEQLIHDCISTESGGLFCGADALDQPDNGTPGQPGDPDGIFGLDGFGFQFEQVNYYSSSTVESSSNHGDGLGPGEGEGECDPLNEDCTTEGTATASGHCKNPPSCSDVGSVFCAILRQQWSDTCRSLDVSKADGDALRGLAGISESDQDMLDGMRQSVDVEAAFGVEIPGMSAVACPAPMSIMVMGETIDIEFDVYCEFFRYLGVFVVISSTLLAFRIAFTNQG